MMRDDGLDACRGIALGIVLGTLMWFGTYLMFAAITQSCAMP